MGTRFPGDVTDHNEKSVSGWISTYSDIYLRNSFVETPSNNMPLSPVTWIEDDDDEDGTGKSFAPLSEFVFFFVVIFIVGLIVQLVLGGKKDKQIDILTSRSGGLSNSPKNGAGPEGPHVSKDDEGVINTTKPSEYRHVEVSTQGGKCLAVLISANFIAWKAF
jgi:hypothetical protein